MEEIANQLMQMILPILATILTAVFSYIGARMKSIYESKVQNETTKKVINDCVKFVEQVSNDLSGKDKFYLAVKKATEVLDAKGIAITEAEIEMLIESSVYALKNGWLNENK